MSMYAEKFNQLHAVQRQQTAFKMQNLFNIFWVLQQNISNYALKVDYFQNLLSAKSWKYCCIWVP